MVKIVFTINGGLYLTHHGYYPRYVYDPETFDGDLEEMVLDIPWDSNTAPSQGRDYRKYWIIDVEIPDYFESPEEWISQWIHWRYFEKWIRFDMYEHHNLTAEMRRKIWSLRENHKTLFAIHQLLKVKNMRSQFRMSLRDQLIEWLNEESEYKSPFSLRQVECLISHNEHDIYCIESAQSMPLLPR